MLVWVLIKISILRCEIWNSKGNHNPILIISWYFLLSISCITSRDMTWIVYVNNIYLALIFFKPNKLYLMNKMRVSLFITNFSYLFLLMRICHRRVLKITIWFADGNDVEQRRILKIWIRNSQDLQLAFSFLLIITTNNKMYKQAFTAAEAVIYFFLYHLVFATNIDTLCTRKRSNSYLNDKFKGTVNIKYRTINTKNLNNTVCYRVIEDRDIQKDIHSE